MLLVAAVLAYFCYDLLHTRYLLRPGASRYTAGEVYGRANRKHGPVYLFRYRVAGRTYERETSCDGTCPPRGTRYYIHYSVANPGVGRSTGEPVPDTLKTVPALG